MKNTRSPPPSKLPLELPHSWQLTTFFQLKARFRLLNTISVVYAVGVLASAVVLSASSSRVSSFVLRDSINASEEVQHEQTPQPLKSVVEEEPDHSNMCEDEIPKEGMSFDSCAEAHAFYKNYASKVDFLVKIKTTNYL
ncbi:hypothetical protein PIB30_010049 [Stylosanthes scabra]|uniref:Uncharacterized protein n=1 Tax=Stylosanthes scabra TaxID=79078 RepID=A0ABU6W4X0_9FABA|nr:hypothetical protein [Stylosanthes scabra]